MGGPGSGRRPTKPRRKGDIILNRKLEYVTVEKTQTGKERRREAVSPRVEAAAVALVSGEATTAREVLQAGGYGAVTVMAQPTQALDRIKAHAVEVAEAEGVTLPKIMQTIARGLDARKMIPVNGESINWPDTDGQLRAASKGLDIHGVGQADRGSPAHVTVIINQMIADEPARLIPSIDAAHVEDQHDGPS